MLAMGRKIAVSLLATSILLCASWGHAMVPEPYEELLAMLADKYRVDIVGRNVETRDSGNL